MRKLLSLVFFTMLLCTPTKAQDVLNYMMHNALETVNDTTKSLFERKVAIFKYDELTYIRGKILPAADMLSGNMNVDTLNAKIKQLNELSYAMHQYLQLYFKRLDECKKKNRDKVIFFFKRATIDSPLFNDEDKELVNTYYDRDDYPLQFCLDCDWEKALGVIRNIDWSKY